MVSQKVPMTLEGAELLRAELKQRRMVERPRIIEQISEARAHGDLSENAEYAAAKEQQSFNEGRIQEIEAKLANAEIVDTSRLRADKVVFGAHVSLLDEDSEEKTAYHIVGVDEANLDIGKISYTSPLARALIGKEVGDSVTVMAPAGKRQYEILSIHF
ncbi:MAG: transcription elongation factor GreA [Magnetococcales bacterium]|nr:transcription elongation factor GreA [Magnetococcales bacterium]